MNVSAFIDICLRVARPSTFDLDPAVLFQQIWNDGRDEDPKVPFPPYRVWASQIVLSFNAPPDRQFAKPEQSDRSQTDRESDLVIKCRSCWSPNQHKMFRTDVPRLPVSACVHSLFGTAIDVIDIGPPILAILGRGPKVISCEKRAKLYASA